MFTGIGAKHASLASIGSAPSLRAPSTAWPIHWVSSRFCFRSGGNIPPESLCNRRLCRLRARV